MSFETELCRTQSLQSCSRARAALQSDRHEEIEGREDEYWSIVKEYVRSLLHRMR